MRDVVFDVASVGHLLDQVGGVRLRSQINREMKAVDRALTSSLTEIETLMSQLTTVAEAMEKAVQENDSKWWVSNAKVRDFAKSAKTSTEQVRKGCEESLRAALRTCAERLAIAGAKVGEI
jgi:Skp family chaperone for outer membrane proteins